jgi:hypothetical protein
MVGRVGTQEKLHTDTKDSCYNIVPGKMKWQQSQEDVLGNEAQEKEAREKTE